MTSHFQLLPVDQKNNNKNNKYLLLLLHFR